MGPVLSTLSVKLRLEVIEDVERLIELANTNLPYPSWVAIHIWLNHGLLPYAGVVSRRGDVQGVIRRYVAIGFERLDQVDEELRQYTASLSKDTSQRMKLLEYRVVLSSYLNDLDEEALIRAAVSGSGGTR